MFEGFGSRHLDFASHEGKVGRYRIYGGRIFGFAISNMGLIWLECWFRHLCALAMERYWLRESSIEALQCRAFEECLWGF